MNNAPPPATVQSGSGGSMLGGIGSTIAQGTEKLAETFFNLCPYFVPFTIETGLYALRLFSF